MDKNAQYFFGREQVHFLDLVANTSLLFAQRDCLEIFQDSHPKDMALQQQQELDMGKGSVSSLNLDLKNGSGILALATSE